MKANSNLSSSEYGGLEAGPCRDRLLDALTAVETVSRGAGLM